jgi:hypothetical protein
LIVDAEVSALRAKANRAKSPTTVVAQPVAVVQERKVASISDSAG